MRTLDDLKTLRVIAEPSETLREPLSVAFPGAEIVADHRALLGRRDLDAVVIATPAATHHGIARDFLLDGKDVLVEKPMTLTSAEAEDLVAVAAAHGRILMVGHLFSTSRRSHLSATFSTKASWDGFLHCIKSAPNTAKPAPWRTPYGRSASTMSPPCCI